MDTHLYKVNLNWLADRKGEVFSPELNDKIEVATPPQFPKGIEGVFIVELNKEKLLETRKKLGFLNDRDSFKLKS